MFARFEVLRFHGFLRVFDALADELRFDRHAFRHTQPVHHGFHFLAAENAEKVVFQREEKSRGAGIALAAGAAAQLVVNAACLVALGAKDMQAAHGYHFVVLCLALRGELIVNGLPLFQRHLENFAFDAGRAPWPDCCRHWQASCEARRLRSVSLRGRLRTWSSANHGTGRSVGHGELVLQAIIARHGFGIAAEQNVGAAAGHVRRNRYGAFASRLRDNFRFALVLLGVQHLVRNARFLQQCAAIFSDFSMEMLPTSTGWPRS